MAVALAILVLVCCQIQLLHGETATSPGSKLFLRHEGSPDELSAAGCRETYNFKHPHPCKPGIDCAFVVKWQACQEKWVEYEVKAALPPEMNDNSPVWVAVGFSSNSKMGDADVIACWHSSSGQYQVRDGYNVADDHRFVLDKEPEIRSERGAGSVEEQVILMRNSTGLSDGTFSCRFRRLVDTGDSLQDKVLSESQYVLVAIGPLDQGKEDGKKMSRHSLSTASTCACDVMSCDKACSCPVGFFYQMLKLHGIVMSITFMLLLPVGALLSRYYKAVFINAWFKAHVTVMVIGVLWSLVGLGLVLTHTRGVFSVGVHQIMGIFVLFLGVLQPTVGFLRPLNKPTKLRKIFNTFHRSVAISILFLSTTVLFWGVYLFHNHAFEIMMGVLCLFVLLNVGFLVVLEILKKNQKFSSSPPVGYHKVVTDQGEATDSEEDAVYVKDESPKSLKGPTHSLEKALLLLFVVVNAILTGLICSFIFYFDAEAD